MKTPVAAATALASIYARNQCFVEDSFRYLTKPALEELSQAVRSHYPSSNTKQIIPSDEDISKECHTAIAKACIRRMVYQQLGKYKDIASKDTVEEALKFHQLPQEIQTELVERYGGSPPSTWWEALEQLRALANGDTIKLWKLILDHPMTAYVPMQCQNCGNTLPDTMPLGIEQSDEAIGLVEVDPSSSTEKHGGGECLQMRGGWFRGRPRGPKILEWTCPNCQTVSQWYRSGHPKVILNPNRWGRLCGEQEDLRLALANFLGVQVRTALPLDWDHIWSEFRATSSIGVGGKQEQRVWQVQDDSARNFAVRLDEGIGSWTLVLAIHPDPDLCQDLTQEYLTTFSNESSSLSFGRADSCHSESMPRYERWVQEARLDGTGECTQAKTVNGYLICCQARLTSKQITAELQSAARAFESGQNWWDLKGP